MKSFPGDRDIPAHETMWPCHVGSGECNRPAVKILDGGGQGDFYVCAHHLPQVVAMADLLDARPELCAPLAKAIAENE